VVALLDWPPDLSPSGDEVERILRVPLRDLADPARRLLRRVLHEGRGEVDIPYVDIDGAELWGATAMILAEFVSILQIDSRATT